MSEMLPVLRIPTTVHNGVRLECYFHVAYFETRRNALKSLTLSKVSAPFIILRQ